MYEEMQGMKDGIERIEGKVDSLGNQLTCFENDINEKIDALFDAREIGIDKDVEVATGLKRVEGKVDKLELKVLRQKLIKEQ